MLLQVLLTVGISQALMLSALLLLKRRKSQADYLLSLQLLLLFLITMLFLYKEEIHAFSLHISLHAFSLSYLALALFYLYVKAVTTGPVHLGNWPNWLHFLPFGTVLLVMLIQFHSMPPGAMRQCLDGIMAGQPPVWFLAIYYAFFLGLFPLYLWLSFRALQRHEHYLLTKFSYTEDISLGWLNRYLWGLCVLATFFLLFEVVGGQLFDWLGQGIGFMPGFVVMVLLVLYLGYFGLKQQIIFVDSEERERKAPTPVIATDDQAPELKYQSSSLTDDRAEVYLQRLLAHMDAEKPYLEPRITIADLSERTGIPANYLSQIINEKRGQNFFDFINSYRVREFQVLLQQPENRQFTLLSLAYDSGFNSKSTFNAIFKKTTGLTPSEYASREAAQWEVH